MVVKLCGMRRAQDMQWVNETRPDLTGMICSPGFRRSVSPEEALPMREALADGIPLVGVFVNPTLQEVLAWVQAGLIDWVQLHGQESESLIRQVQRESGLPVIKAFTVHTAEELHQAADSPAEHLLLDSGTGTGKAFDWRLLAGFQRPYLLAGGLHPENVGEAIQQLSPWGVDTSSGIETEGWKDPEKMRRFVAAARSGAK